MAFEQQVNRQHLPLAKQFSFEFCCFQHSANHRALHCGVHRHQDVARNRQYDLTRRNGTRGHHASTSRARAKCRAAWHVTSNAMLPSPLEEVFLLAAYSGNRSGRLHSWFYRFAIGQYQHGDHQAAQGPEVWSSQRCGRSRNRPWRERQCSKMNGAASPTDVRAPPSRKLRGTPHQTTNS